MSRDRAAVAALNNAVWCDAVCRARGGATAFAAGVWHHADPSPPFFPSVVTLAAGVEAGDVLLPLRGIGGDASFGIKDSFCRLDLGGAGFARLFEARWLWRDAGAGPLPGARLRWARVGTQTLLAAWAAAWWPDPAHAPPALAVFAQPLLADPTVYLLAGFEGSRLVAGCAVTRSDDVAGLSCCFCPPADAAWLRSELLGVVQRAHPGRTLVTYERGDELQAWLGLGFVDVGPLQVWLGRPTAG
jgi:hypothetical protein